MASISTVTPLTFERASINGMEVLLAPRPGTGLVAATAIIRRGSADESSGEHGVASFTTSMFMRGTQLRNAEQLAYDLESIGAIAGESDGMDAASLSVRSAAPEAPEALEILFEALREPAFDPREHEINRQETLADLRMQEDEKFGYTYREYLKVMFAGHGYGHPTEGEVPDVERLAAEDCRRWHGIAVRPENLLFVAAGELDTAVWKSMLARLTREWTANSPARPRTISDPVPLLESGIEIKKPGLNQGFIVIGYRTPPLLHEDYPALRLASAVLGEGFSGRIFTNLREKRSLAYALGSMLRAYRLAGHQVLYIGTKPESIEEARDALLAEAEALRIDLVSDEELNRAREYVLGKHIMGQQSVAQRVGYLASWHDATGDAANAFDYPEKLRRVTPEQLRDAVRRWWIDPLVAILRPEG